MLMFGFGVFLIVISCIRIPLLLNVSPATAVTDESLQGAIWSSVEVCIGICVACMPALRQFISVIAAPRLRRLLGLPEKPRRGTNTARLSTTTAASSSSAARKSALQKPGARRSVDAAPPPRKSRDSSGSSRSIALRPLPPPDCARRRRCSSWAPRRVEGQHVQRGRQEVARDVCGRGPGRREAAAHEGVFVKSGSAAAALEGEAVMSFRTCAPWSYAVGLAGRGWWGTMRRGGGRSARST
ncbi:hypothetical protein MCOR02_012437 [Pyricularia oryzae]|nr:hypothetical protein MCOR02_012437 [Pyricularia oryzae]